MEWNGMEWWAGICCQVGRWDRLLSGCWSGGQVVVVRHMLPGGQVGKWGHLLLDLVTSRSSSVSCLHSCDDDDDGDQTTHHTSVMRRVSSRCVILSLLVAEEEEATMTTVRRRSCHATYRTALHAGSCHDGAPALLSRDVPYCTARRLLSRRCAGALVTRRTVLCTVPCCPSYCIYCTALHCIVLYCTVHTVPHCTALRCTALHCTALRIALHCTVLYCIYCTAPHCAVRHLSLGAHALLRASERIRRSRRRRRRRRARERGGAGPGRGRFARAPTIDPSCGRGYAVVGQDARLFFYAARHISAQEARRRSASAARRAPRCGWCVAFLSCHVHCTLR